MNSETIHRQTPATNCNPKTNVPIHCPLDIAPVSTDDFRSLDYVVMGHVFASQNEIGRLADEKVYRVDVAQRLRRAGLPNHEETPIELTHKTFAKTLFLDLVVSRRGVYELKTVTALNPRHHAQLITYLYLLNLPRGKLVNFRSSKVEAKFVNAPICIEERTDFSISDGKFRGDRRFLQMVIDLVRDWGTSLSASLYHQAIVHLLGGPEAVERMLLLYRNQQPLGKQRFHLVDNATGFEITTFASLDNNYADQLQRLVNLSPIQRLHWINIGSHCITAQTVERL